MKAQDIFLFEQQQKGPDSVIFLAMRGSFELKRLQTRVAADAAVKVSSWFGAKNKDGAELAQLLPAHQKK